MLQEDTQISLTRALSGHQGRQTEASILTSVVLVWASNRSRSCLLTDKSEKTVELIASLTVVTTWKDGIDAQIAKAQKEGDVFPGRRIDEWHGGQPCHQ
jgi:hypothetical protein